MNKEDYTEFNYENLVPEWNYSEFKHLEMISEPRTLYARGYYYNLGEFYIEPWFYTQLTRLFERFPNEMENILKAFFDIAKKSLKVLFTRDINDPVFKDEEYLYVEINEVAEKAALKFDDISRGSDYGD